MQINSFKFLHAADIHLDSPLSGLEQYEGAPVDVSIISIYDGLRVNLNDD